MAHLSHFCHVLPHMPYVDTRPAFGFEVDPVTGLIKGTVVLPNCIKTTVRRASGNRWWRTERSAMKDAAFQAYVALYKAGLVNDNMLPFRHQQISEENRNHIPSTLEISEQFNPWVDLAHAWSSSSPCQALVSIKQQNGSSDSGTCLTLTAAMALPPISSFCLYWDSKTTFAVHIEASRQKRTPGAKSVELMRQITHTLLRSTHSDASPDDRNDFVVLFAPDANEEQYETWLTANRGRFPALEAFHCHSDVTPHGLIRNSLLYGVPHIFTAWRTTCSDTEEDEIEIECVPLMRRRNFLHRGTLSNKSLNPADQVMSSGQPRVRSFPAKNCTIDLIPFEQAQRSLLIPAILQHLEVFMVANRLRETILKDVPFKNIHHIITAISASSAQWVTNYQRYEFLGDGILKFSVSSQLFAEHETWHEGCLSKRRDSLVSNSSLAVMALDAGLDTFILTKSFSSRRWAPPLISDLENRRNGKRSISAKILADVVEAIIGAAFLDGGLSLAMACIHRFLPDIPLQFPTFGTSAHSRGAVAMNQSTIARLELLIGYKFVDKALLVEALTHPSSERDAFVDSYQRLEFLGDAVLDMIVVSVLFEQKPDLSHGDMTMVKAALVNADLLAFMCMEHSLEQYFINIKQTSAREFSEVHEVKNVELWRFMRHHSKAIGDAQMACSQRHQELRQDIQHHLQHSTEYPWALLSQMNADKFFSDIVESILGAIFVDCRGTLAPCHDFANRIGIIPYLRRVTAEGIAVGHPKTRLGQLAGRDKVEYITGNEEGNICGRHRCLVQINKVDIVAVGGCLTTNEAVTRAADAAVKLIATTKSSSSKAQNSAARMG